jgi:hypothetical protein
MNTKIKYGILTFAICLVLGIVVPVTIGTPNMQKFQKSW